MLYRRRGPLFLSRTAGAGQGPQLDRRAAIERELSLIEAYEKNLVDAIAKGQAMDPLLKKLEVEEARRAELTKELEQLTVMETVGSLDEARMKRELKARLGDLRGLLRRHISGARQLLKILLDHPLRFETVQDGEQRGYRILGTGSYLPLLENAGESLIPGQWCPQRDSNPCVSRPTRTAA